MKTSEIGKTGVRITELSFGTSALGSMPDTYGYAVDETRARETLLRIFDSPVNMIDVSRNYGSGRSEERIGAAIADRGGLPDGFVISTKLDRDMETGRFDGPQARRSIEESLEALRLDKVDILHLHDPEHAADLDEITGSGGALEELFKMKEEGLARAVGLAMGRISMMFPILKDWPFDALINHNRFTLLNREAEAMYDYAAREDIAVINAAPFAGGVLAKGADQMKRLSYQPVADDALSPVRAIEDICGEHGIAPGAAALQFSMRDPRVATTLVGVSRPASIDRNLDWASARIPDETWAELMNLPYSEEDPEANRDYKPG